MTKEGVVTCLPCPMWNGLWAGSDWAEGDQGRGQDTSLGRMGVVFGLQRMGVTYQVV